MKLSYPEIRKTCLKPDEGVKPIYARIVTHAISTRLIWFLQDAAFSPNAVTLAGLAAGFAALPFFAILNPASVLVGALLIEAYYVLDAMDGQWARLKGAKSLTGAFFDCLGNYVLQPPILFAIAWGMGSYTREPRFYLLGFTAAFSTLWLLVMWNLRWSVLLDHFSRKGEAPPRGEGLDHSAEAPEGPAPSLPRRIFSVVHKTMVFPWFMHVLSLTSLVTWFIGTVFGRDVSLSLFAIFILYYGLAGPIVAALLTAYWILTKKIYQI